MPNIEKKKQGDAKDEVGERKYRLGITYTDI